jgi:hypothetical protein
MTLHYGLCVMFPMEEWHTDTQILKVDEKEEEVRIKEGIRYHLPHPSRIFLDSAHRPSTLNSNTGARFGGYWRMVRYGEVANNARYWNNEQVSTSVHDYPASNPAFFNTLYNSTAIKFTTPVDVNSRDREGQAAFYTTNDSDRFITLTEYFECVNPKEEGIGDYDHDVWFRYVIASDDTVIYAAPLPYTAPLVYYGYDTLETRSQNPSLTLEALPFQDHITNLFSQYILTLKNNLTNITFFDTNQVDKDVIDWIKNLGESSFRSQNFAPMDMRRNKMAQQDVREAFQSFKFPQMSTEGLMTAVKELLGVLDRILVLSPQELAQTATHELTAEEVRNMNAAKSTRYEFTAGMIDQGVYAWKVMLYQGLMAYGDDDLYVRLPMPVDAATLDHLGFTVEADDGDSKSMFVKGSKSAILIESFASTRDGDLRVNNTGAAQAMTQFLGIVLNNQPMLQELGIDQVINLMNEIVSIAGLPRDFRFVPTGGAAQQQIAAMQQQLAQIAQSIEQQAAHQVASSLTPVLKEETARIARLEQGLDQLLQRLTHPVIPPNGPPPMPIQGAPPIPPGTPGVPGVVGPALPVAA